MQVSRSTKPLTNHSWQVWRSTYNNHINVKISQTIIWVHREQATLVNAQSHKYKGTSQNMLVTETTLWIPFHTGQNGCKISYQQTNWNSKPLYSTLGKISASFGVFRQFRAVSINFTRNKKFGRYEFVAQKVELGSLGSS